MLNAFSASKNEYLAHYIRIIHIVQNCFCSTVIIISITFYKLLQVTYGKAKYFVVSAKCREKCVIQAYCPSHKN